MPPHQIRARLNSRAVLGGALVTAAAVIAYTGATAGDGTPTTSWVVVDRPVAIGQAVDESDIRLVPIDLPGEVASGATGDPDAVVGRVTTAPLQPGELVSTAQLREPVGGPHEITIAVDEPAELLSRISPGEQVELVATFGSGDDADTRSVGRARIVAVETASGGLDDGRSVIAVATSDGDAALAAIHASRSGQVSLVRHDSLDEDAR
jgi:pilus assembly protein CpaB